MKQIDLLNDSPAAIAESARLEDLLKAVRSIAKWEERHAEVLDHTYRHRLVHLIRSKSAAEGELQELLDHLDRVTHQRRFAALENLGKRYGSRWLAYMDILDGRLALMRSPVSERWLNRKHVRDILNLVPERGEIPQSRIKEKLDLRPANLTRVLDIMEANELIERRQDGRENLVRLGPDGVELVRKQGENAAGPRMADYLRAPS